MSLIEKYVYSSKILTKYTKQDENLLKMYRKDWNSISDGDMLRYTVSYLLNGAKGRRAKFLENKEYKEMLLRYLNQ